MAAAFGRYPWEINRLPRSRRQWLIDYMIDLGEYEAEAMKSDDEDDVEDIDADALLAAQGIKP